MTTILLVARSLDYGGAERQLVALAEGLKQRGHDISVVVFYGGGHFQDRLKRHNIKVEDLKKQGRWDSVFFLFRFAGLLRKSEAQVVYGFLSLPNILIVLLRKLVPTAKIVWGLRATNLQFHRYNWLVRWVYRIEDWLATFCDQIIVNSNAGRLDCERRKFPASKLLVIPNGIDTTYFSPDHDAGREFRLRHSVSEDDSLIGIVGRLDPMKDHPTFMLAFALLSKEIANVRALVVGTGSESYQQALSELAMELGIDHRVIWLKPSKDMRAIYNAIDVLVSSSSFGEGFSNVVAEAMSCGTPCVVTRVGDSAEIVGNLGEVVRPQSAEDLARAVTKTLNDAKRDICRRRIRARIKNHFSVDKFIDTTESALCLKE